MGSVFKAVTKPVKDIAGAGLPLLGIDNPLADNPEISKDAVNALRDAQSDLKKKKAGTFTSGGFLGEEFQSGNASTTFGN